MSTTRLIRRAGSLALAALVVAAVPGAAAPAPTPQLLTPAGGATVGAYSHPTFRWSIPERLLGEREWLTFTFSGDTATNKALYGTFGGKKPGSFTYGEWLPAGKYTWTVHYAGNKDGVSLEESTATRSFRVPLVVRFTKVKLTRRSGASIDTLVTSNAPIANVCYRVCENGKTLFTISEKFDQTHTTRDRQREHRPPRHRLPRELHLPAGAKLSTR